MQRLLTSMQPYLVGLVCLLVSTEVIAGDTNPPGFQDLLTEAGLSFLGLGAVPPAASWGVMLNESRGISENAPWLMIYPGLAIMLGVLGFNLLGDGLRDVLDPRMRGRR